MSSMVRTPPPTVSGMKQASAVRRTTSSMIPRFSWVAVMSRKHSSSAPAASYAIAASTGSPASRRSTKLTPLTTRPSLTSRQGITRTLNIRGLLGRGADQGEGGCGIEPAIVKRAAGDRASELFRARRQHRLDVLDRGEAAGGNHGNRDRIRQRDGRTEIQALEQAIARDVGEDDGGDAGVLEPLRDLQHRYLRGLGPTFDRDLAVTRIEPDRDPAGEFSCSSLHQFRIAHRGGADDDPGNALVEPGFNSREIANAATELHRYRDRLQHRLDGLRVHRLAGKRTVEIDDVEILKALRNEARRLRGGIEVEHGRARHVALFEAHALAVFEVDRRKENHGFHRKKFEIRAKPKRWLFSG